MQMVDYFDYNLKHSLILKFYICMTFKNRCQQVWSHSPNFVQMNSVECC